MYTDAGFLCPYFQDFSQEVQQLLHDELFHSHQSPSSMIESSFISEEPIASLYPILDPMEASISMTSFADQNQEDDNFELLMNEIMDTTLPSVVLSEVQTIEKQMINEMAFQKSASTGSLNSSSSMAPLSTNTTRPSFLDFPELDFGEAYGMRRASSEGDIETLSNANLGFIQSSSKWPGVTGGSCSPEDRQQKLSRYRFKKLKRNFGRKIKYACRKALADSQPRIRGRFARMTRDTLLCQKENDSSKCIDMKDW